MSNLVDIVIPLSTLSNSDNLLLRLALRSIHRYAMNLGNIFIYTTALLPWIEGVTIVNFLDSVKDNKDANLFNKLLAAANNPDIRLNFIFWSDDQVLTDYVSLDCVPIVCNNRGYSYFDDTKKLSKWQERMKNTLLVVKSITQKLLPYNYDAHTPQPYKKSKVILIFSKLDYNKLPGLCINTAYYGLQEVDAVGQANVKHTLEGAKQPLKIPSLMKLYLGYNLGAWKCGLSMFLLGFFYLSCPYLKAL